MTTNILLLLALLLILLGLLGVEVYGHWQWQQKTIRIHNRLVAQTVYTTPQGPKRVDFAELEDLPFVVQRYLREALTDGQPLITQVQAEHQGQFNLGGATQRWFPFTSQQRVMIQPPGFLWDAQISPIPGIAQVLVHDAYIGGEGILTASLGGWISMMKIQARGAISQGELQRFLAEALWYPTALLPSQGVKWIALDETTAQVILRDGLIIITMTVYFNAQGLVDRVQVEDRVRAVGDRFIPTPWEGRFWDYQRWGQMLIPLQGEVAWLLPEGRCPYWRGTLTSVDYTFI
ncbi:MAG: DUF6920 family protein [Prochlorotrichaceae cyanobacterium]